MFVVAENLAQAKSRALRTVKDWDAAHRDDLHEAEQAFSLDGKGGDQRFHIVVNAHPMIAPASPNMLSAGTIIAGSLITGLRSDLPGSGRGDGNAERL